MSPKPLGPCAKLDPPEYLLAASASSIPELDGLVIATAVAAKGAFYLFQKKTQQVDDAGPRPAMASIKTRAHTARPQDFAPWRRPTARATSNKLDAAGKVTTLKKTPTASASCSRSSRRRGRGDFLLFGKNGTFHVYDVATDS